MSTLLNKIDSVELWWWQLPTHYRWFIGAIPTAVLIGLAGGVLN